MNTLNKQASWLFSFDFKCVPQSNINLLIKEGLYVDRVAKLMQLQPRTLLILKQFGKKRNL
jgi:mTERF domain-containing protein